MSGRISLLLALLLLAVAPAQADIYRYVDANGVIHFTDCPNNARFQPYQQETDGVLRLIRHYAGRFDLEEALVKAVIKVESDYDTRAVSRKGAQGLMQLIPETARYLQVADPFDPADCIRGGSLYLRQLLDRFGELELALAAYNAGPTAVQRYGGIPPYPETQNYVQKVKQYLHIYRTSEDTTL